ncbi:murein DD-endopeptidase MepM/ murein hydrolase activator NlpD [Nonomuraea muscovyensis]|uniref:Murein DD-endopeptidase MepM/ murein hydrolase activator NlpD n=1 Tax=Nonomuraea muscovyensis TaxID=1124761 RepID=A0A7X0BZA3_9ACTN|nr:M23 family metallopeptidase [Nonomuraea muscovyensis]MBB6345687.1 murein DD-endopeptidase MepM/ murein hydrolase activator NlpD [Nonomuraea muscovyensis]
MKLNGVLVAGCAVLFGLATATAAAADPAPAPTPTPTATATATPTPTPTGTESPAQLLAAPNFQLPFPCGQTWNGNNSASSAHKAYELDFNRGATAGADLGDTVVAAAAGTVGISAHQGSVNGFGNLVTINHGGGYVTYYAHLNSRSVSAGQTVSQGQKIGTVGKTSRPGNNISPHLHFEVRKGSGYPSNIQRAVFDGKTFPYPAGNVTSKNKCSGGGTPTNPHTPEKVCGSGYKVVDSQALGSDGRVYLLYSSASGNNCVATVKAKSLGANTTTAAFLEVQGSARKTDSGSYGYYAGPVTAKAPGKCVKWGGKAGVSTYTSPFEHCGS